MLSLIVAIAPADAAVLHLAPPTPSKRKHRRLTTHPLITTPRFDSRRFGIVTEATMLGGNRLGCHPVGPLGLSGFGDRGRSSLVLAGQVHDVTNRSILSDPIPLTLILTHLIVVRDGDF